MVRTYDEQKHCNKTSLHLYVYEKWIIRDYKGHWDSVDLLRSPFPEKVVVVEQQSHICVGNTFIFIYVVGGGGGSLCFFVFFFLVVWDVHHNTLAVNAGGKKTQQGWGVVQKPATP